MITLEAGQFGNYLIVNDDGADLLVQTDWDYPGLASSFGFVPCECGETDGTVNCAHKTATEMINDAVTFLDDNLGKRVEDPGYFSEDDE